MLLKKTLASTIGSYSICCFLMAFHLGGSVSPGQAVKSAEFEPGHILRVSFEKSRLHSLHIMLRSSEFLNLTVTPRHARVRLLFKDPQGQDAEQSACVRINGVSECAAIASKSGSYSLRVEASSIESTSASYCEIRVVAHRSAQTQDRTLVQAVGLAHQGNEALGDRGQFQLQRAIRSFEASLALLQKLGDEATQARVLSRLANLYLRQGRPQKAQKTLETALQFSRTNRDPHDPYTEAAVLYMLARMRASTGENEKAIELYRQVVLLREKLGDSFGLALAVHNLASAQWALGENGEALKQYQKALQIRERIQDQTGVAYTLYGIAVVYWTMGSDQDALDSYGKALHLWRKLGNRRGEANTLNSIGLIYSGLRDRGRALRYFDQSLSLWESLKDRSGEAYTRNNLGMVFADQGKIRRALDSYQAAIRLLRALKDVHGQAYVQHNLGTLLLSSGETEKAMEHLELSLQLKEKLGDRFGSARTKDRLAEAHLRQKNAAKALQIYREALALQRQVGDRTGEMSSLGGLARAEESLDRLPGALKHIRTAIRSIETLRLKFRSDDLRTSFFANWHDYYALEIQLLMKLDRRHPGQGLQMEALQVSEQARSRSLLAAVPQAEINGSDSAGPQLTRQERDLRLQIDQKVEGLDRLKSAGFVPEQREKLEGELDQLLQQYHKIREELHLKSPHYSSLLSPPRLNLDEVQHNLIGHDDLLLEYFLGKGRSFLWAITSDSLHAYELPSEEEINSRASRFYDLLTARNRPHDSSPSEEARQRVEQADGALGTAASALSSILLGSLPPQLRRRRLILVCDGSLHYVPFAAFPEPAQWRQKKGGNGQPFNSAYLGVEHEIVSLPSLAVLSELRRESQNRSPAPELLALFADPVFARNDPRLAGLDDVKSVDGRSRTESSSNPDSHVHSSSFQRLRFSRFEAEEIGKLVPAGQRLLALDFAASRRTLEEADLRRFRFLHFATHTVLDNQHPELSGIVLSEINQKGKSEDGVIRLYEIYNLKLRAELVALSSCRSALGKRMEGEGLIGLARGFLYSGASSVLASLWQVQDRATAVFMRRFYTELITKQKSRPQALQSAQKAMLQDRRWRSPYYWAAFVLQGDWR